MLPHAKGTVSSKPARSFRFGQRLKLTKKRDQRLAGLIIPLLTPSIKHQAVGEHLVQMSTPEDAF